MNLSVDSFLFSSRYQLAANNLCFLHHVVSTAIRIFLWVDIFENSMMKPNLCLTNNYRNSIATTCDE